MGVSSAGIPLQRTLTPALLVEINWVAWPRTRLETQYGVLDLDFQ